MHTSPFYFASYIGLFVEKPRVQLLGFSSWFSVTSSDSPSAIITREWSLIACDLQTLRFESARLPIAHARNTPQFGCFWVIAWPLGIHRRSGHTEAHTDTHRETWILLSQTAAIHQQNRQVQSLIYYVASYQGLYDRPEPSRWVATDPREEKENSQILTRTHYNSSPSTQPVKYTHVKRILSDTLSLTLCWREKGQLRWVTRTSVSLSCRNLPLNSLIITSTLWSSPSLCTSLSPPSSLPPPPPSKMTACGENCLLLWKTVWEAVALSSCNCFSCTRSIRYWIYTNIIEK